MDELHIISLKIDLKPIAKGRPRFGKWGKTYTPQKTVAFEETLQLMVIAQLKEKDLNKCLPGPFLGPCRVSLKFIYKGKKKEIGMQRIKRPDIDNLIKSVCDALNGIIWHDDSQISHIESIKIYGEADYIQIDVYKLF